MEEFAKALDDREAEAQPLAALAGGVVQLMVFFEDRLQLGLGDADPGVPDLDAQFALAAPAAEEHPAALGVFQGVRNQVAHHLLEQAPIAANGQGARDDAEAQAGCLRVVGQFLPEAVKQVVHREVADFGLNGADFDLVDVEQRVQHARHGAQSVIDAADQLLGLLSDDLLRQQALERARGFAMAAAGRGSPRRGSASWRCSPIPPDAWRR